MAEEVWLTNDGREIPVSEMSDRHLRHALRFIRRQYEKATGVFWDTDNEDSIAAMAASDMQMRAIEVEVEAEHWIRVFEAELRRRGARRRRE